MYSKLVSLEPQSVTRMKREDGGHWDFGKWIPDGGAGGGTVVFLLTFDSLDFARSLVYADREHLKSALYYFHLLSHSL